MFFITTANQRFWKKDEKILFLGGWCKPYATKETWSKLDYEIVPYHWDNRKQLYRDYLYLKEVYERYLQYMANRLNELHGEKHTLRYWRIIIGPWLHYFIAILFDRYNSLKQASKAYKIKNTLIAETDPWKWVPQDMSVFIEYFCGDEYNHMLYSRIIRDLELVPYELIDYDICSDIEQYSPKNVDVLPFQKTIKSFLKRMFPIISKFTNPSFVFVSSYFGLYEQAKLEIALWQLPSLFRENQPPSVKISPNLRRTLSVKAGCNEFESLLDTFIPEHIPAAYVENYQKIQELGHSHYPKKPKVIFTAVAYAFNEGFKCWAAEQVEKGTKLVIGQHGGHYGSGLWNWSEEHQIKIADQFITWGWIAPDEPKTQPLPTQKLIRIKRKIRPNYEGYILWVFCGFSRYSYWMYSAPVASQFLDYLEEQVCFVKILSPAVRRLLLLRYNPRDYGWGEAKRMRELNLGIRDYYGKQTMEEQLNQSRLFIGTYNGTTYLETLAANFPTILFWNPTHCEMRDSAQPYFDELYAAEILHDTPESAARKVNEVYHDPENWWLTSKVQEARNIFCNQFAKSSPYWIKEWKTKLSKIANDDKL